MTFSRKPSRANLVVIFMMIASASAWAADNNVNVLYAGSLVNLMERSVGPAFEGENGDHFQGFAGGSNKVANEIKGKLRRGDVFVSANPKVDDQLMGQENGDWVRWYIAFAESPLVIGYNPASRFVNDLKSKPWYEVLQTPGVRFGRTDPATDPQGQNIIFTMLLAQNFYKQPGLADRILGGYQNTQQIFTEPSVLSRMEAGQIDASSGYLSAARSQHLPFIALPDEINLSNPEMDAKWYKTIQFSIKLSNGKEATLNTQPLVFYAAVLKDSKQPALAEKFVQFLQSPQGQKMLEDNGYSPPKGGPIQ